MEGLKIYFRRLNNVAIIRCTGEINVYSAASFRETLVRIINAGNSQVLVDLRKTEFLDSTGLGVLAGVLKRLGYFEGRLAVLAHEKQMKGSQYTLMDVFTLTGLVQKLNVSLDFDEALAGFQAKCKK